MAIRTEGNNNNNNNNNNNHYAGSINDGYDDCDIDMNKDKIKMEMIL